METAATLLRSQDFEGCQKILQVVLAQDPDGAEAYNLLGFAYQAQGDLDSATGCFRKTVDLQPDAPGAHNNLAAALARSGRLEEAVAAYDAAIRLAPTAAAIRYNKAVALAAHGRTGEAIAAFEETLALDADYRDADRRLTSILARVDATAYLPVLDAALTRCFASPRVDYVALARTAARQLTLKYDLENRGDL